MEDLMVLCNSTASIYELPLSPTSNGQIQPATQLDEVGSQSSKDVDLDAEGYIHHFRDSSPQQVVALQRIGSNTSFICAPSDDVTNKPDPRRNAAVIGSSSDPDNECYTISSNETFKDARKTPAMTRSCLTKSSKESLLNEHFSKNADRTIDYAAMRSMVQAPPDPTIWGNRMTKSSTCPITDDTEDCRAPRGLSVTDSHLPGPAHWTASRPATPPNAHEIGERNTASGLGVENASRADPSTGIPSYEFTSDAAGLATQAWVNNHYGVAEDSDTSAASERQGTVDHHGNLDIQDNNDASRVGLVSNRGDQCFSNSDDSDRSEPKATQKVGSPSRQPNIRQCSGFSNSQDIEQDRLLAVSLGLMFGDFTSTLT